MIWFVCKSCGKKHSRPETEIGAMVFCSCGTGVRVPFSSTTEPAPVEVPVPKAVPMPGRAPMVPELVDEDVPAGPARKPAAMPTARVVPVPVSDEEDEARETVHLPPSDPPLTYRKAHRRYRKVDPFSCWHHEETRSGGTCTACKLPFCLDCLVELNGQQLCGPCKNFRAATAGQPVRTLPLASIALVCALLAGPVTFLLSLAGAGAFYSEGAPRAGALMVIVSLLLPLGALNVSWRALVQLEQQPRLSGRGMAASGLCVSLASLMWGVTVLTVILGRTSGG